MHICILNKLQGEKKMTEIKDMVFFKNNSWYHKVKILNEDGTISHDTKGSFDTKEEAEQSWHEHNVAFDRLYQKYVLENKIDRDISFKEYLKYWFDVTYCGRITSRTRVCSSYLMKSAILPNIKDDIKLRYVTTAYLNALLECAAKVSPSAGNETKRLLYMALNDAVIEAYILENPMIGADKYKRKKPDIKILNKEQLKVLLQAASTGAWYMEIMLCVFCGLRKGEVLGLKFSDFDFEKKTMNIQRQLSLEYEFDEFGKVKKTNIIEKEPKTENSNRILRVPDAVLNEVKKRRLLVEYNKAKYGNKYHDNDYTTCQPNGLPRGMASFNIALTKLCKKNGLPLISVHSLRHMYATILSEQGVQLSKISALLGHTSINTTFEYYCEVMDEKEKIIEFMNDEFV